MSIQHRHRTIKERAGARAGGERKPYPSDFARASERTPWPHEYPAASSRDVAAGNAASPDVAASGEGAQ